MHWPLGTSIELRLGIDLIGGGRGVFALQPLHAGHLILRESPLITVPIDKTHEETLHASLARAVVESERRGELLGLMASFHPRELGDIPTEGLERAREDYKSDIERLAPLMVAPINHDPPSDGQEELESRQRDAALLLLLKVQCNSFYSGIYLSSAMFNHRCNPNAIKLAREGGSEIRALREIEEGEEVTFSYVTPPLQSFIRRQDLLLMQHYFSIDLSTSGFPVVMEESSGGVDGEELRRFLHSFEGRLDGINTMMSAANDYESLSGVLEDLSSLSAEAKGFLHPRHISIARLNELIMTASRRLLGLPSSQMQPHQTSSKISSAITLIRGALDLKETQELYCGSPDHYDLALTLEDLYVTIEHLLSNDPKALFAEFKFFSSFSKASLAVSQFKKKHRHIIGLYSRD